LRYVPQLKKNLISVDALEALDLEISGRDGVLKMLRGSMVVLKGIRQNNLYYLKGNTITGKMVTSISLDDNCSRVWHMWLEHISEKFCKL